MMEKTKEDKLNQVLERLDKLEKSLDELKEDIQDKINDKFDELFEDMSDEFKETRDSNEENFETLMGRLGPPGGF